MTRGHWYALLLIRIVAAGGIAVGFGWLLYASNLPFWAKMLVDSVLITGVISILLVGPITYSQRRRLEDQIDKALEERSE